MDIRNNAFVTYKSGVVVASKFPAQRSELNIVGNLFYDEQHNNTKARTASSTSTSAVRSIDVSNLEASGATMPVHMSDNFMQSMGYIKDPFALSWEQGPSGIWQYLNADGELVRDRQGLKSTVTSLTPHDVYDEKEIVPVSSGTGFLQVPQQKNAMEELNSLLKSAGALPRDLVTTAMIHLLSKGVDRGFGRKDLPVGLLKNQLQLEEADEDRKTSQMPIVAPIGIAPSPTPDPLPGQPSIPAGGQDARYNGGEVFVSAADKERAETDPGMPSSRFFFRFSRFFLFLLRLVFPVASSRCFVCTVFFCLLGFCFCFCFVSVLFLPMMFRSSVRR